MPPPDPARTPPPLRPRAADVTIPLADPPLPDPLPRLTPASERHAPPPSRPRHVTDAPPSPDAPANPPPGVGDDTPEPAGTPDAAGHDAPETDGPRLETEDTGNPASDPGPLASDDEIHAALEAALDAPEPAEPTPPTETPEPPRSERRWGWADWRRHGRRPAAGQTGTRLARHLSYEVVVTAVTFLVASILLFASLNGETRDLYVKARQLAGGYPAAVSGEVAMVTLGAEALYLWNPAEPAPPVTPRALLGEVVTVLDEAGARVIVLDFLLEAPADGDARLKTAIDAHGRVVAAERYAMTDPAAGARFAAGPTPALGKTIASGLANLGEEPLWTTSEDRLVRSLRLVEPVDRARLAEAWPRSVGQAQAEREPTPHLALLAAWLHRHPDQRADDLLATLTQACTGRPLRCDIGVDGLDLPASASLTGRFPLNFRGPEHNDGLPTVRAASLLRLAAEPALYREAGVDTPLTIPDWLREAVEGRTVVVGRVDAASKDRFATPFTFPLPTRADMDGARIQAQALDTLLTGRHVTRSPTWIGWGLGGVLGLAIALTAPHLREDLHTLATLALGALVVAGGVAAFLLTDGWVLDLRIPLLVLLLMLLAVRVRGWAVDP